MSSNTPPPSPGKNSENDAPTLDVTLTDIRFDEEGDDEVVLETGSPESRYEIGELLGAGGMGEVFEARDRLLERSVAIKFLRPNAARRQFFREAKTSGLLTHPNIPPVYDIGIDSRGRPFYVMQLIRGRTFAAVLESRAHDPERWSLVRLLGLFQRLCAALEYAHDRGLVHLDVKPANIMTGEQGQLYLVDWGLCSSESEDLRDMRGTPAYMSPEQALANGKITEASDIYSLGCVLYEICCGSRAFPDRTASQVLERVRTGSFDRGDNWKTISPELRKLLESALSLNPSARPSARELGDGVQRFLEGTAEAERRREAANEAIRSAVEQLEQRSVLQESIRRLTARVEQARPEDWIPVDQRSEFWTLEDELRHAKTEADLALERATSYMLEAHRSGTNDQDVLSSLGEFYWDRFQESEAQGETFQAHFFRGQLRSLEDPAYTPLLDSGGTMAVALSCRAPVDLEVWLLRERGPILEAAQRVATARIEPFAVRPWVSQELPVGSYELHLRAEGFRSMSVPVAIQRGRSEALSIELRRETDIGEGFIWVPGGPCTVGGDDQTFQSLPLQSVYVPDFCIAKYPVTWREYRDYLQSRQDKGEDVTEWIPKLESDSVPTWQVIEGEVTYSSTPAVVHERRDWPIFCVTYYQAKEFCRWYAEESGLSVALPTDLEWEKAARGVDRRLFPWGNRFDPSLCLNGKSTSGRAQPGPVGAYPFDRSPYGVRDLAGGIREWCDSWFDEKNGLRLVRGGSWNFVEIGSHCAYRLGCSPGHFYHFIGFRLAHHF